MFWAERRSLKHLVGTVPTMNGIEPEQTESQCSYRRALVAMRRTPSRKIGSTRFYNSAGFLIYGYTSGANAHTDGARAHTYTRVHIETHGITLRVSVMALS